MPQDDNKSLFSRARTLVVGGAHSLSDKSIFHRLTLVAFFAWVGLGADGLSSTSYGPAEAHLALEGHIYLGIFVAIGTAITVFVISASYSQIIDQFPSGGGGYVVASKLLTPELGMVSGCALLIDYVLTISVSIAAGSDAIFSSLPKEWLPYAGPYKLAFAGVGVVGLTVLNLRGVRESVMPLVPVFLIFLLTHAAAIVYGVVDNVGRIPEVVGAARVDVHDAVTELGLFGTILIVLRAYGMGAGTFTGIEAVSNAMPLLREPRVKTARRTMRYMAWSLALTAVGLMVGYILYNLGRPPAEKTVNAMLLETMTSQWAQPWAGLFVLVTLLSESAILFVAAQTGFLGGPRVLANMSSDRWFPTKFTMLSDRLVTQNGILLMGAAALAVMLGTGGEVHLLVILYSINVFITFCLSQLGMVRHWWQERKAKGRWRRGFAINGMGLVLCVFILVSLTVLKFEQGGWVTLLITGSLVAIAWYIHRQYQTDRALLKRLDSLVPTAAMMARAPVPPNAPQFDPQAKTAVLLVSGFNGVGLHSLLNVVRLFGESFQNFAFVNVGVIDAGNFKGVEEVENLNAFIRSEIDRYVGYVQAQGHYAEGFCRVGVDIVEQTMQIVPEVLQRFPRAVFFGGQLVFAKDSLLTRLLHNNIVFAIQRRCYQQGIPFVVLPIRVDEPARMS
ncbi:MAG: APC family permease [Planctomycetaceae bacterium]|nr:APC family permease [Planctomycetaceae bacterium]